MQDADLYGRLQGLEPPWRVARVTLDVKDQKVDVYLEHGEGPTWSCPQCGKKLPAYDHKEERVWRHLDTMQFQTWVHARSPRVECPDHGVRQVNVPWAEAGSRFTKFFERFAIDVREETDTKGSSKILRLSWGEAWGIQDRAVARGLARKPLLALRRMGVDEKAVGHGQKYATLVYNLEMRTVEPSGTILPTRPRLPASTSRKSLLEEPLHNARSAIRPVGCQRGRRSMAGDVERGMSSFARPVATPGTTMRREPSTSPGGV